VKTIAAYSGCPSSEPLLTDLYIMMIMNILMELTDSNVCARRGRNIRYNVFVLNAITNSFVHGDAEVVDV
jgi:DNA-binding protein